MMKSGGRLLAAEFFGGATQPWAMVLVCALSLTLALGCGNGEEDDKDAGGSADSGTLDGDDDGGGSDGTLGPDGTTVDGSGDEVKGGDGGGSTDKMLTARSLKFTDNLYAVWASGPNDIWWVGANGRILHDNGEVLAPRDSGTDKDLYAVWGLGPDNVWFAGDGILLQWDAGTLYNRTPEDHKQTIFKTAHAPSDGSTLLIAGSSGTVLRYMPDKDKLVQEQTGTGLGINDIWAESAGIIWAVGESGQAMKLSGGSWSTTTMPKAGNRKLTGIDGFKSRMFAVGEGGYVAATDLDDKTWQKEESNDPPPERDLRGVWAVSEKEAWAIGVKGALMHKTGKSWGRTDIDGAYMKTRSFNDVFGLAKAGPGWAVGDGGAGLLFKDGKWLDYKAETTAHLTAVAALSDGRLAACGKSGLLLLAADAKAPFVDVGAPVTATDLNDVADDGKGGVVAVGQGGVVVHIAKDGSMKASVPAASGGKELTGVALVGSKQLAVGLQGTVMVLNGGKWSAETTGVQWNWRSVASAGGKAWAVGDNGQIRMRDASGKWTEEKSGTLTPLRRVIAWGDGEAVAVGDNGVVLLRSGGAWKSVFEEGSLFLYGVTRRADGTVIAVGFGGNLVVGKDGTFKKLESGLFNILSDVASTSAGTVAVGFKGGVYQVAEKL